MGRHKITRHWTPAFAGVTDKGGYLIVIPAEAGIQDVIDVQTIMTLLISTWISSYETTGHKTLWDCLKSKIPNYKFQTISKSEIPNDPNGGLR